MKPGGRYNTYDYNKWNPRKERTKWSVRRHFQQTNGNMNSVFQCRCYWNFFVNGLNNGKSKICKKFFFSILGCYEVATEKIKTKNYRSIDDDDILSESVCFFINLFVFRLGVKTHTAYKCWNLEWSNESEYMFCLLYVLLFA